MPKHPLISIPLDIPDVRVLQTELAKAGELLGVEVLDHLVIGQGRSVSMLEKGLGFTS